MPAKKGWHVPLIARLSNDDISFFVYKHGKGVGESINRLCLKSIPPQQFFVLKSSDYTQ